MITASLADEAAEEMALEVHAEAPLVICVTGMRCEQTAATSLVVAQSDQLVVKKLQHLAKAFLLANRPVVKQAHDA